MTVNTRLSVNSLWKKTPTPAPWLLPICLRRSAAQKTKLQNNSATGPPNQIFFKLRILMICSISHEIYTRFRCVLCMVVSWVPSGLMWSIYQYSIGLLHWHRGNRTISPVPVKQPWKICLNLSLIYHNKAQQSANRVHISWDSLYESE